MADPAVPVAERPHPLWTPIADDSVKANFECPKCHKQEAVTPSWMADNGSPICPDCDTEMAYFNLVQSQ
ncbi:MAG: hypothetical protein JW753_11225 [Dehalococcoidia bacterium]|nr:hypothetical protein [Dehalococcoidia bacterium]